jgi:hypothetical protein
MSNPKAADLRALADWAESRPPGFDQNMWLTVDGPTEYILAEEEGVPVTAMREGACRTSACLAGRWVVEHAPDGTVVVNGETLLIPGEDPILLPEWAAQDMGLSYEQALAIFYAPAKDAIARLRYVAEHQNARVNEIERAVPCSYHVPTAWVDEGTFGSADSPAMTA